MKQNLDIHGYDKKLVKALEKLDRLSRTKIIKINYFLTFKNLAFIATIIVLNDISAAPEAGEINMP